MIEAYELMEGARSDPAMVALSFTREKPGTFDGTTEQWTSPPSETSIACKGIEVGADPERYAALGLSLETMPTLFVIPDVYPLKAFTAEFILPGDRTTWNGVSMIVKSVDPVAPDGGVVSARIVVAA